MSEGLERWSGKVALVTGASSGIGRATAEVLAAMGMRVALSARRADRLEGLKAELEQRFAAQGAQVLALAADLSDEASIHDLFARLRKAWGGVDVLINNAGVGRTEPMISTDLKYLRTMLEVNVWAPAVCIREALEDMAGKQDAAIVNISSMAAHHVVPGRKATFYSATKHALRALTEGLRSELQQAGSPVKLALISPGIVETEFQRVASPSGQVSPFGATPLQPRDIADAVRYILSVPRNVQINDILLRPVDQAH